VYFIAKTNFMLVLFTVNLHDAIKLH